MELKVIESGCLAEYQEAAETLTQRMIRLDMDAEIEPLGRVELCSLVMHIVNQQTKIGECLRALTLADADARHSLDRILSALERQQAGVK